MKNDCYCSIIHTIFIFFCSYVKCKVLAYKMCRSAQELWPNFQFIKKKQNKTGRTWELKHPEALCMIVRHRVSKEIWGCNSCPNSKPGNNPGQGLNLCKVERSFPICSETLHGVMGLWKRIPGREHFMLNILTLQCQLELAKCRVSE